MLKKRLAAVLILRSGWVVQSFGFSRHLPVGRPAIDVEYLNRWGADEIICLDMTASPQGRGPDFEAVAVTKIGPVKARFKGKVHLTDLDPPNRYRISGEGDGGVAGFAKGGATVILAEKDGGTLLTYSVEAQIGGKLAQLGQRLVNGAAKKIADDFFKNFAAVFAPTSV